MKIVLLGRYAVFATRWDTGGITALSLIASILDFAAGFM